MKFFKPPSKVHSASEGSASFAAALDELREYEAHLRRILQKLPMPTQRFAAAAWYHDPNSHDCPHDAWLIGSNLSSEGRGDGRSDFRIILLGAYHDRRIEFLYTGVTEMQISLAPVEGRAIEWLCDEFDVDDNGFVVHEVLWDTGHIWKVVSRCVDLEIKSIS